MRKCDICGSLVKPQERAVHTGCAEKEIAGAYKESEAKAAKKKKKTEK